MGKIDITATSSEGNSFTPIPTETTQLKKTPRGYSVRDTVASAKPHSPAENPASCCPAADRMSNWFSNLSCLGQTVFVIGSILTLGLLALITLLIFTCSD